MIDSDSALSHIPQIISIDSNQPGIAHLQDSNILIENLIIPKEEMKKKMNIYQKFVLYRCIWPGSHVSSRLENIANISIHKFTNKTEMQCLNADYYYYYFYFQTKIQMFKLKRHCPKGRKTVTIFIALYYISNAKF